MSDTYQYWREALAGKKPKMYVDDPRCGLYRRGVYRKDPNVRNKRVGWTPVSIMTRREILEANPDAVVPDCDIVAVIGILAHPKILTDRDQINELWSYCAGNPISEAWYRAVAEEGKPWPDSHEEKANVKDELVHNGNADGASVVSCHHDDAAAGVSKSEGLEKPDLAAKIAAAIKTDVALIAKYKAIDSDEMSSKARSLQNKLLDSRGAAGKAYDAANRPLLDAQKALREIWFPIRDEADAGVKELAAAMGRWEDSKRAAAKLAQEAADKAAREHAEAVRKAEEANKPAPPPPPEVKPNVPVPSSQIRGGAGRAASVSLQKFVTEIDAAKVFEQFKGNAEVIELLTALAQKTIRAGIDVVGAKWEERSVVR